VIWNTFARAAHELSSFSLVGVYLLLGCRVPGFGTACREAVLGMGAAAKHVRSPRGVSFHVCCVTRERRSAMLTVRVSGSLLASRHWCWYTRTQTILGRATKG